MFELNCKGRSLVVDNPLVMGIINATPDSFYKGSLSEGTDAILKKAEQMLNEGADILDIGGQSTRPGSVKISVEEELRRVIDPIEAIQKRFPDTFISIDTYYSNVAKEAVSAGASIVNDISGGSMDENMYSTVASLNIPYVLMHIKGVPETMQQGPQYDDVTEEVKKYFSDKIKDLQKAGVYDIIIDPGFGFGKVIAHNFELLKNLSAFQSFHRPIMIGLSRKSSVYKTLNISANEALNGTTVLNTIALMNGASILRVHDVKEAKETVKLFLAYLKK
jgi:dihydropteroate synthase